MEPMTARAIVALRLTQSGLGKLDELRAYEKSLKLPPGRYLLGFEIMQAIRRKWPDLKIDDPTDSEVLIMDTMWRDFDKLRMGGLAQLTPEIIHKWEDWAMDHFRVPV